MTTTLQNLREASEVVAGDTANVIWADAEWNSLIKEGYNDLVRQTGILWKKDTPAGLVPVASTGTYTLPTDLLQIERLTWKRIKLDPVTPEEAQQIAGPLYRSTTGDIWGYIVHGDGVGTIRYVRVPSAAGASTDIAIEYQRRGATLSADGTAIEIPDRYAKYIRWFAYWKAYERDGQGQDLELSEHYRERYQVAVARVNRRKQLANSARTYRYGGGQSKETNPRPRMPWNYGKEVR